MKLRLANKELADRTIDAFTAKYLEERIWYVHDKGLMGKLRYLEIEPKFALSIQHLSLTFNCTQGRCSCDETPESGKLVNIINSLLTLRSIELDGLWDCDIGYKLALRKIRLPRLESLVFSDCQFRQNMTPVSELLNSHNQTLMSVKMRDVHFSQNSTHTPKAWIGFLEAAKTLRNGSIVEVLDPRIDPDFSWETLFVSFLPLLNLDITSNEAVIVASFTKTRSSGHYRTEAGNLHESLTSMIRNYREFRRRDDMVASVVVEQPKDVGSEETE